MSDYPKVAEKSPAGVTLTPGRYFWCSCGLSANQPFCDGSHNREPTGMRPVKIEVTANEERWLCRCKRTKTAPDCDGSHNRL